MSDCTLSHWQISSKLPKSLSHQFTRGLHQLTSYWSMATLEQKSNYPQTCTSGYRRLAASPGNLQYSDSEMEWNYWGVGKFAWGSSISSTDREANSWDGMWNRKQVPFDVSWSRSTELLSCYENASTSFWSQQFPPFDSLYVSMFESPVVANVLAVYRSNKDQN